jgi:dTDP-4-dehydrorhamnose reductase
VNLIVTGAAGMLAKALVPALEAAGHDVLAPVEAQFDVTSPPASLVHDIEAWRTDWVIHLAAFTKVDDCESQPETAHAVNAEGSRNVAIAAHQAGAGVVALSTDYVFDGRGTTPYREDHPAAPQSVYGRTKWEGEQAVRETVSRHQIVRTAWLYGAGGPNFVDTILRKARAGERLRVVDDQRGSPTFTVDLAEGLTRLLATGRAGTFHCTNSGDCTWYDLAAHVIARAGLQIPLERTDSAGFPRPAKRPAYSVLSNAAFEAATGWRMPHWKDAVDRYLESSVPAAG